MSLDNFFHDAKSGIIRFVWHAMDGESDFLPQEKMFSLEFEAMAAKEDLGAEILKSSSDVLACKSFTYEGLEENVSSKWLIGNEATERNGLDETESMFSIFPNPALRDASLQISFDAPIRTDMTLQIIDATGRYVFNQSLADMRGSTRLSLDLDLPVGVYSIQVKTRDTLRTQRWVRQ